MKAMKNSVQLRGQKSRTDMYVFAFLILAHLMGPLFGEYHGGRTHSVHHQA